MGYQFHPGVFSVLAAAPAGGGLTMGAMLGLAVLVGAGLVLWARGAGLMKWATAVVGAALGVGMGVAMAVSVPGVAAAGVTPLWGALGGMVVGAIAGLALCRAITAGACGLVGAGLGLVVAGVALERGWVSPRETAGEDVAVVAASHDADEPAPPRRGRGEAHEGSILDRLLASSSMHADAGDLADGAVREAMRDPALREEIAGRAMSSVRGRLPGAAEDDGAALPEPVRERAAAAEHALRSLGERATEVWSATPAGARPVWLIGAAVGWALGMVLALAMPRHGTMAGSAAVGAALVLAAGSALAGAAGWDGGAGMTGAHWALAWLGAAVAGSVVQWSGVVGPRAKTPAPARA